MPIHGGSLRLGFRRGARGHCAEALALEGEEARDGLRDWGTYRAFAESVRATCDELGGLVGSLAASGQRVIGYGASAKGNTLLNRCGLDLAYVVDDNPLKHGYLTPGRGIPVRAPADARGEPPGLNVLLLAWNFAREIVANWRRTRPGMGDHVIHYVPRVLRHAADADLPPLE